MTEEIPKLFISYSWSTPDLEEWVIKLATELRENGVDVILDKWDLKEGHDANAFMEKMGADKDIRKVVIVCDKKYSEKADGRKGGVGTETQIITSEIYKKVDQNKFVAVVVEKDENGKAYLPIYYQSRVYIDLSDPNRYSESFEKLLRWVYDKPLHQKPSLGKKPEYLDEETSISLLTTASYRRALDAIKNNKDYCEGAVNEYFEIFTSNFEKFRLNLDGPNFDDQIMENIEQFMPYRDEAHHILLSLAQYRDNHETHKTIHRFLERLLQYSELPHNVHSRHQAELDNFKFIIQEMFLLTISSLIEYERFEGVGYLLRHEYYLEKRSDSKRMVPFTRFRAYIESFAYRNKRLILNRLSVQSDLLHKRFESSKTTIKKIMQTDFVIFLRDSIEILKNNTYYQKWFPDTLLYAGRHSGPFEIFARAESQEYFNSLKRIFDIESKDDLIPLIKAFKEGKLKIPTWHFDSFDPYELMNFDQLATKP